MPHPLSSEDVINWFRPWIEEFLRGFRWPMPPGTTVTSWYRPRRSMNDESQHRVGVALDFAPPSPEVLEWARRSPWHVVVERDHVHVQFLEKGTLRRLGLDFSLIP